MMRSLSSAVAGLRTHQVKMDVIGNNIANVNTYGFKSSRATFADMYYQNLAVGSAPSGNRGGTNPTQIGYGSSVATVDIMNNVSGASSTDRAMDVYITGEGFLVTQDSAGNFLYTRLGNLGFDAEGNLIDPDGNYVMGFPKNADGTPKVREDGTAVETELENIKISPDILNELTSISIGPTGEIIGLLPGDAKISLGSGVAGIFTENASVPAESNLIGDIKVNIGGLPDADDLAAALGLAAGQVTSVNFGDLSIDAASGMEIYIKDGTVYAKGKTVDNSETPPIVDDIEVKGSLKNGKLELSNSSGKVLFSVEIDKSITSLSNEASATAMNSVALDNKYQIKTSDIGGNIVSSGPKDFPTAPNADGNYDLDLNSELKLEVKHNTGSFGGTVGRVASEASEKVNVGCIVLANFRNANGLQQAGNSKYTVTANSGEASYYKPGVQGTGTLLAGNLEVSNVDLSKEFTDMITTQRGFQANTRIVTVSDEMLQELVNLKR